MNILIREFLSQDKPVLISLMEDFNEYIQSIDDKNRTNYKPNASEYFTDKMIRLSKEKKGIILVASNQDKIVGFISGYIDEQDEDEKMETISAIPGVIGELFVLEEYRGHSIGKQLLNKMEEYLNSKGCTIIRFAVFSPNTSALKFYEHLGYSQRVIYVMKELK